MLRITVEPHDTWVRLKLEGVLTGSWVRELEACWRAACRSFRPAFISVDLSDCSRVDDAGHYLLALLHANGTRVVARGLEMSELAESLERAWPSSIPGRMQKKGGR